MKGLRGEELGYRRPQKDGERRVADDVEVKGRGASQGPVATVVADGGEAAPLLP